MKATLTLLLSFSMCLTLSAQNVPNGNFEGPPFTWKGYQGGLLRIGGQKQVVHPNGDTLVMKPFAGNGCVLMSNTDKASGLTQKFALTSRPDSFVFQYNFIPFGEDVAGAKIIMTRFDDKTKLNDTLVNETILITDTVSLQYKRIAYYIGDKYNLTGNPDTGYVEFSPSMNGIATPNSFMGMDDIDLVKTASSSVGNFNTSELVKIIPNPIIDKAIVSYSLNTNSSVRIAVYDVNGKEIQVVLNANQNAGMHQTSFDVTTLKAGVYFCKTMIGSDLAVQRIVVSQ